MRTIKFKVSYEKLISRLPAMFAFMETDAHDVCWLTRASDGELGDYGKVIADMVCPGFDYTCADGTRLLVNEGVNSYRTIIDAYYKAKADGYDEGLFMEFVKRGIGLKYVGLSSSKEPHCGVILDVEYPLAPDYIYLGEAKSLYNKMIKMKRQLDFWQEHIKTCEYDSKYYEALKKEYEMYNGDKLVEVLWDLMEEAKQVAEEYYRYAQNYGTKLKFNVNLHSTIKDLGMVTSTLDKWVPGKSYRKDDVVLYTDDNGFMHKYVCLEDNAGYYDSISELVYFPDGRDIVIGHETITLPMQWLVQYRDSETDETLGLMATGECNSHLNDMRRFQTYMNTMDQPEYPEPYKDWLWYYRKNSVVHREEVNDELGNVAVMYGQLDALALKIVPTGLEAIKDDLSNLVIERVGDWDDYYATNLALWGDVITEIRAENDYEKGSGIISFTYWRGAHLAAKYVKSEQDNDGNLKHYFSDMKVDLDSLYGKEHGVKYEENYIYYEDDVDVIATEDFHDDNLNMDFVKNQVISGYYYSKLQDFNKACCNPLEYSIWHLVKNGMFDDYVNGAFDKDSKNPSESGELFLYEKMRFSFADNLFTYRIRVGSYFKNVAYIKTKFQTSLDVVTPGIDNVPFVRYDYFNGVTYNVAVNGNIYVDRGSTQAFEKHIKLSEIKTLEDLENYANGGFFILSKEDINVNNLAFNF